MFEENSLTIFMCFVFEKKLTLKLVGMALLSIFTEFT